jgi:3-methyladenine DNA glycosylase AlkC
MAEKLKNFFDADLVRGIARDLHSAWRRLDEGAFAADCLRGLNKLELTERGWHVAAAMRKHLPPDFEEASKVIVNSLGPELTQSATFGLAPLRYMPHVFFVGRYGLEHFEASMRAQYELTKRFSAESSMRSFLIRHPEATYVRLREWATDPNVHVRRLVSEGTRPRLPWAPRLKAFQENPEPVLRLLELLKDDAERYVQRSVANNLNDIAKDHPDVAAETCRRWLIDATPGRRWIVGHALRSLVKQGNRGALELLGFGRNARVRVSDVELAPRRVRLGGTLRFSFVLTSTAATAQDLLVDYAVHFVKADGERRPKVFKLRKLTLPARSSSPLRGSVSFAEMTTRKARVGQHLIELLVNGRPFPLGEFEVVR